MTIESIQTWVNDALAAPGILAILVLLLVYFGAKALFALFESVEEIIVQ